MILRLHHLLIATVLGVIAISSNALVAQEQQRECLGSQIRFNELANRIDNQHTQEMKQALSGKFDIKLYHEHLLEFDKVVSAGRKYLNDCSEWDTDHQKAEILWEIAHGLIWLGQTEDAIPLFKRCLALDHDFMTCAVDLGDAYHRLCRYDEAKEAYTGAIAIGGFTEFNAQCVEEAKAELSFIEKMKHNPNVMAADRDNNQCPTETGGEAAVSKRFGSGFIVSKQGYVLTNNHVVEGCRKLITSEGRTLTLVDRRPLMDLALLKLDATPPNIAIFRSGPAPKAGDTVFAFGFPLPDILSSEGNISTGILSAIAGVNNNVQLVQISAPVQPGNSGGPLLDSDGHIIGVVVAKLDSLAIARLTGDMPQNINFAVHWAEVKAFLDEEKVEYFSAPSTGQVRASLIADRAKQFSVRIECTE
jgi:S1-C subfamily serine protease